MMMAPLDLQHSTLPCSCARSVWRYGDARGQRRWHPSGLRQRERPVDVGGRLPRTRRLSAACRSTSASSRLIANRPSLEVLADRP